MYCVYVIYSERMNVKYTGQTENINLRVEQHNNGTLGQFTKNKGPWKLIFKKEFETRKEAMYYEKYLKTGKGREFVKSNFGI